MTPTALPPAPTPARPPARPGVGVLGLAPVGFAGLVVLLALLTSGCGTQPASPPPKAEAPPQFHEAADSATTGLPMPADGRWWQVLADPALDPLMQRASTGNLGVQQALIRVAQARALARAAGAQLLPQAGLAAGASQQGGPLVNAAGSSGSLINIGASLSYEVDLFGRGAQQVAAASQDLRARQALARSAELQLQAQVAHTVLGLRGLADELALVQAAQQAWQDTLALQQRRQQAGLAPAQQAARLRAEAGVVATDALVLQQRQTQLMHSLALLLGEDNGTAALPSGLLTPMSAWSAQPAAALNQAGSTTAPGTALPVTAPAHQQPTRTAGMVATAPHGGHADADPLAAVPVPNIPAGLPASMLQRRPDIAAALHNLQGAQARLGLARSAWLPGLTLTANGGRASSQLADLLLGSARSWGLAGLLTAPLFDGGRRDAAIEQAAADLDLATLAWREQVLVALHEVDDQLATLRHLAALAQERQATRSAADQAERLTTALQQRGLVSQLEVLDARRQALAERRAAVQLHTARRQASVALVRALGGGWGPAQADAAASGTASALPPGAQAGPSLRTSPSARAHSDADTTPAGTVGIAGNTGRAGPGGSARATSAAAGAVASAIPTPVRPAR